MFKASCSSWLSSSGPRPSRQTQGTKDKLVSDAGKVYLEEVIVKAKQEIEESSRKTVESKAALQPRSCGYSSKSIWWPVERESSYKVQALCRLWLPCVTKAPDVGLGHNI